MRDRDLSVVRPTALHGGSAAEANASGDRRAEVRLVVVHLKSKRGDEAENAGRRVQQARHVAELLGSGLKEAPKAIALGDFNDDLGSEPLEEFRGVRQSI